MGFFDDVPAAEPEPPRRQHHPWEPPQAQLPGNVPIDTLSLGRTGEAAVAITGITAYQNGFEILTIGRLRQDEEPSGGPFRFGMQLADGRKVIGGHPRRGPDRDAEPTGPILWSSMRGRGPHTLLARWWAWPLPPDGPLEFVFEWPAAGIDETHAGLDARLILDAAGRSVQLWPEDGG